MNGQAEIYTSENSTSRALISDSMLRKLFLKIISHIEYGKLVLQEGDQQWNFGTGSGPSVHIRVYDSAVYRKLMFGGSIGAGESYIDKMWDADDLTSLIRIMARNMTQLDALDKGLSLILRPVDLIRHRRNSNSKSGSKKNILAHYDLGNDMYEAFLDSSMMYSSAIYPHQAATLWEAQQQKLKTLCERLDLKATDSVVEIGTGWGGFAIYAARNYGCHVTTTTISDAQYEKAKQRIADAGLTDKITLLKSDYRDLRGSYDRLVSVEMIEAVGHRFLPQFFKKCSNLLKPDGKMVLQAITITDQRYKQYIRNVDFIQRHIFPGGCLPSVSKMVNLIADKTDMVVRSIDDFGTDYARTIDDWLARFKKAYPDLDHSRYDERFKRLWEFYLCYCQGGFLERYISVVHLTATRPDYR